MPNNSKKESKIIVLLVLDTIFCIIAAITGYTVPSFVLANGAFRMLSYIFSLVIALRIVDVSKNRSADADYTYGWHSAEILGALINAVFLFALCVTIFIEAVQRFISPKVIRNPKLIFFVGVAGLSSNFIGLVLFHDHKGDGHSRSHFEGVEDAPDHGHSKFLNMESIFLHVVGEAIGNFGVIISALLMWKTNFFSKQCFDGLATLVSCIACSGYFIFSKSSPSNQ